MSQHDMFGAADEPATQKPFRDIRNTRPTVAEEKAQLVMRLGLLINRAPPSINKGSINLVCAWKDARAAAAKVAANKRASVHELSAAISNMERFAK
jgi:hypothetical protein